MIWADEGGMGETQEGGGEEGSGPLGRRQLPVHPSTLLTLIQNYGDPESLSDTMASATTSLPDDAGRIRERCSVLRHH